MVWETGADVWIHIQIYCSVKCVVDGGGDLRPGESSGERGKDRERRSDRELLTD